MRLLNWEGVPKVGGDLGGPIVTSKMGNGTKFRLSSVLPNVFSKIKGIRRNNSVQKLPSSASVLSETASIDIDQKDFFKMSRDSHRDRSPSPERTFPQNRNEDDRYLSSPVHGQKSYDIRFPVESPINSKATNKSGPLSPPPLREQNSADIVDPGCCSYESTMALVPHDGRVRRLAPQAFGKCLIMSKCNSFNGSTHSDSEISETDSRAHVRIRHSRAMSVQLEGSSCDGYQMITADERGSQGGSGKVSIRQRSSSQRIDNNAKLMDHSHELYGGSSPIQAGRTVYGSSASVGKCCRADHTRDSSEGRESAILNSSGRKGNDLDHHDQTNDGSRRGRLSRKLSFTADDNARHFDDSSFSSEDDFYNKVVTSNGKKNKRGHYRSRSTSSNNNSHLQIYSSNPDTDLDYTSSEVVYTEDDRGHAAAILRREALLTKTVLNASDGWAEAQLSRFSQGEKPPRRASCDGSDRYRKGDSGAAALSRETALVETVLNAQGWTRENLRALAKVKELDRRTLARINAGSLDLLIRNEEEADKVEYESFGLPPNSKDFFSHKSSRHSSPVGEVEKYTEGRVDYKSISPVTKLSVKAHKTDRNVLHHEELVKPVADYGSNPYSKSGRSQKSEKEMGKPWDTEFPSFRSDSILMGGGNGSDRTMPEERAAALDCSDSEVPTALTPRYLERQRQNKSRVGGQQQDFKKGGKVSSRIPSPGEEAKNFKLSNQPASPRLSREVFGRPKRSPSSVQEFSNGKKTPGRPPSPNQEVNSRRNINRTPSPVQDLQPVKKPSRTPSPARSQSPQAAATPLTAKTEAGMQRLDSVAVVKASYDPYHDFRESMVEMILENDIQTAEDLEDLLQCYLSLNSSEYRKIIVQVFSDVWADIFEQ